MWTYIVEKTLLEAGVKVILLKLFVTFLRNCPVLDKLVDTERLESHRVPLN